MNCAGEERRNFITEIIFSRVSPKLGKHLIAVTSTKLFELDITQRKYYQTFSSYHTQHSPIDWTRLFDGFSKPLFGNQLMQQITSKTEFDWFVKFSAFSLSLYFCFFSYFLHKNKTKLSVAQAMGQEKSVPIRCNSTSISHHSSAASSTSLNSTKSLTPSRSPSTASSSVSSTSSYRSVEEQTKYLSEHLYIKSYLEIDKEEHLVKAQIYKQIRPGIRNYKPKILKEKFKQEELEVWIWGEAFFSASFNRESARNEATLIKYSMLKWLR